MKVAILISGFLRTFNYNIEKNKKLFSKYNCDYYIHLSKNEKEDQYFNEKISTNEIQKLCNPKFLVIEEEIEVKDYKNIRRMWYKINLLNKLKRNYEECNNFKYDIVIRIRPDLFILDNELNLKVDKNCIYGKKMDNIFLDEFNYGDSSTMDIYCSLFFYMEEYLKKSITRPDDILKFHSEKMNFKLIDSNINHKLVLSLCNIIGITGDSGSGKSKLMNYLSGIFINDLLKLECDRYHKWERGDKKWENYTHLNPEANYITKFSNDVYNLKIGNDIHQVDYDHKNGKFTQKEKIKNKNNVILCGLHTLFNNNLNKIINFKIFLDTDENLRRYWKIKRDVHERGYSYEKILKQIKSRVDDYHKYILPQKENSDFIIKFYCDNFDFTKDNNPKIKLELIINSVFNLNELIKELKDINFEFKSDNSKKSFIFEKEDDSFQIFYYNIIDKYMKNYKIIKAEPYYYIIIGFVIFLINNSIL